MMDGEKFMGIENKKGKKNRFNLVEVDKFDNSDINEDEFDNSDINEDKFISHEEESKKKEISEQPIKEEIKDKIDFSEIKEDNTKNENKISKKLYINFGFRVAIIIVFILAFFATACYMILEAINFGEKARVNYQEKSNANYQVCSTEELKKACFGEGLEYNSALINNVNVNFDYNVDFSTDIKYDLSYYIVANIKVVDNNSNLIYNTEETILDKKELKNTSNQININEQLNIDYEDYNQSVRIYTRDNPTAKASVTLKLIVIDSKEERKVTTVDIPLQEEVFTISVNGTNNSDYVEINNNEWNTYNSICAGIASVLIIIALGLVYYVTRLILKVTNHRSEYQAVLTDILREYDRLIVIARDGYESNISKEIIEVESFEELLDVRDTLEKPIIFSKVNDVKSEFIVENDEKLYKFILKEADVLEG